MWLILFILQQMVGTLTAQYCMHMAESAEPLAGTCSTGVRSMSSTGSNLILGIAAEGLLHSWGYQEPYTASSFISASLLILLKTKPQPLRNVIAFCLLSAITKYCAKPKELPRWLGQKN